MIINNCCEVRRLDVQPATNFVVQSLSQNLYSDYVSDLNSDLKSRGDPSSQNWILGRNIPIAIIISR